MAVHVRGAREFRAELRKADRNLSNEMRGIHRRIADHVVDRTHRAMSGPQASKAGAGVKARATNSSASIDTVAKPPFTLGVIWGQRRRSGWYAASRYEGSTKRQFAPWVGNQWDPGEHGGEPYFIGDAINGSLDEIDEMYLEGVDDLTRRAFPD